MRTLGTVLFVVVVGTGACTATNSRLFGNEGTGNGATTGTGNGATTGQGATPASRSTPARAPVVEAPSPASPAR